MQGEVAKAIDMYFQGIEEYKDGLLQGQIHHVYRNGRGDIIDEVSNEHLEQYKHLIKRLPPESASILSSISRHFLILSL